MAVAIVLAIVLDHPFNKRVVGLNCILLCLNNSRQIAKKELIYMMSSVGDRNFSSQISRISKLLFFPTPCFYELEVMSDSLYAFTVKMNHLSEIRAITLY